MVKRRVPKQYRKPTFERKKIRRSTCNYKYLNLRNICCRLFTITNVRSKVDTFYMILF